MVKSLHSQGKIKKMTPEAGGERVEIRILDNNGNPLCADQLPTLKIWNNTINHVCASALDRIQHGDFSQPDMVAKKSDS